MEKEPVFSENAPRGAGPYSPAVRWGNLVFVSGQASLDPTTNQIVHGTFEEEAERTFQNVKALVEAAGSSMEKVLKVNVYLADINDFEAMNAIYRKYFPEPFPARTTVQAPLAKGLKIEVDVIAALD